MAVQGRNTFKRKSSGARVAALVVVVLILGAIAGYFLRSSEKTAIIPQKPHVTPMAPVLQPLSSAHNAVRKNIPAPTKITSTYPPVVTRPEKNITSVPSAGSVKLAVIIDDMGKRLSEARALAALHVPLTFAIIPGLRDDKAVAAFAAAEKIETMIHIPMQSKGWPAQRLESNGLLVDMSSNELQERVSGFMQRLPEAVGANNHMGSEFTEREDKMTVVLQSLKKNNLFFVDSLTSTESAGIRVAGQLGMLSARRNVFLDNEQERNYILGQLKQAVQFARKNGSAIAICHPHSVTIDTLAAALPELAGQGVQLVAVSQLVK